MTTATTAPATCKYFVGQAVEVFRNDFSIPGFPYTWQAGIVETVELEAGGIWSVKVQHSACSWSPLLVGKRGGNKFLRPA